METISSTKRDKKPKALIAMSGGVDSSMAAKLMQEAGYECIGCMMKLWDAKDDEQTPTRTCCSLDDAEDARSVASRLGMPFYVFNFTKEFENTIIADFVRSYENARTPNPCIECNRCMKFGKLYIRARELGCDCVVTGHYARIEKTGDRFILKKALDESKDQSYVLYQLTQEQLAHICFPLGMLKKDDVREIAKGSGFVNFDKPDSQDICFVPDGNYAKVVEKYSGKAPTVGNFVDKNGRVLGRHKGLIHYTIGQRKGLGISSDAPLYVLELRIDTNEVVLGSNEDLFAREVMVERVNWISGKTPEAPFRAKAKIRYRHKEQDAIIEPIGSDRARIIFEEPQRAVTPGQSAVIYDGDEVLGGGIIV